MGFEPPDAKKQRPARPNTVKNPPDFATQKKGHWTKYYVLLRVVPRELKRSDSFGKAEKRGFTLTFVRYSA